MQTDQALINDWYKSYMASQPQAAATAATPQAGTTEWKPDTNSTVAGQFGMLTAKGNPLMTQATTQAKQQANAQGMLNSTMAIQAGQIAGYNAALPIAQQDAATFADAGRFNAGAQNTAMLANANIAADMNRFNAGATNDAATQQRASGISGYQQQQQIAASDRQQAAQIAESQRQQAAQIAESQRQQAAQIDANTAAQIRDIEAQAAAQGRQLTAQETAQIRELEAAAARQQAGFTQEQTMQQAQFEQQRQMLTAQTDEQLRMLDAQNGTKLADAYRATSQATYDAYIADVQRIQESDMDPDVKAAQVQNLQGLYETRQQYINTIYANTPGWSNEWSQFAVEFAQPAEAAGG